VAAEVPGGRGGDLALGLGAALLGPKALGVVRHRRRLQRAKLGKASTADATLLYLRFLELLGARGYTKPPWFTPTELARSVRAPEIADLVEQFVAAYQDLRFGAKAEAAPKLLALLKELEVRG
jgi:hypothetical protein